MTGVQTCALPICFPVTIAQFEVIGIQPIDDGQYADLILLELDPLPVLSFANADTMAADDFDFCAGRRDEAQV